MIPALLKRYRKVYSIALHLRAAAQATLVYHNPTLCYAAQILTAYEAYSQRLTAIHPDSR